MEISEINQLFDDILIIWPAPAYFSGLFDAKKAHKMANFTVLCVLTE